MPQAYRQGEALQVKNGNRTAAPAMSTPTATKAAVTASWCPCRRRRWSQEGDHDVRHEAGQEDD